MNFILGIILSHAALAAPDYQIPENALWSAVACQSITVIQEKKGSGWSEWEETLERESFRRATWLSQEGYNLYEDKGEKVRKMLIQDSFPEPGRTKRKETIEDWAKNNGSWKKDSFVVEATLYRHTNGLVQREELQDGKLLEWQLRSYTQGPQVHQERILMNPNAWDTDTRRYAYYAQNCSFDRP